jgi:DNA-binding HxlR family transcriptional regulator
LGNYWKKGRLEDEKMLKRYELPPCPVETALVLAGDRWKMLIVRDLLTGTKRFGQLKNPSPGSHRRC